MTLKWRSLVLAAGLFMAGAAPAVAQSTTGTITGRAVDSSGAILPGVAVSITSPQMIGGSREAITDSLGTYRFTAVPPGVYQVKFQLATSARFRSTASSSPPMPR
jgi:hypothetical protein